MSAKTMEIIITVGLAVFAFVTVSAVTMVIIQSNNNSPQVLADHGDTDDPSWVREDGTIDMGLVPDRLPLADGNGGILGYIAIDKDPNDDPNPGEPGFEEWNNSDIVYVSETGNEIVGHIWFDTLEGDMTFEPIPVNEEAPIENPQLPE